MNIKHLKLIFLLVFLSITSISCKRIKDKIKTIEYSMHEGAIYRDMKVDPFYWDVGNGDIDRIPLLKPYALQRTDSDWMLGLPDELYANWSNENINNATKTFIDNTARTFPIRYIYAQDVYIYGFKDVLDLEDIVVPSFYFIIDTQNNQIKTYDTDHWEDFSIELKSLGITEDWVEPDILYDDFKFDPILPWFPQEIKNQLKEVKKKLKEFKS